MAEASADRLVRRASPLHDGGSLVAGAAVVIVGSDRLASDIFAQLDRYGVVTRGSVLTENAEGGFGAAYRALSSLEEQASVAADTSSKAWVRLSSP